MKTQLIGTVVALAAAGISTSAMAGSVTIGQVGGGITLNSGDLSATVFGAGQPNWSATSLASVHAALNADGVVTDNKVTTLLADTDHGLALLILIDSESGSAGGSNNAAIHMTSFGYGSNLAYINDVNESVLITPNSPTSRLATGNFSWDTMSNGDGFGWAELIIGNTLTFQFARLAGQALGLDDPNTFQFVTYTANGWQVVGIPQVDGSFTSGGQYGFAAVIIPLPTTAAIAAAPLAGLGLIRRRRA